jgi:hypothetical protein
MHVRAYSYSYHPENIQRLLDLEWLLAAVPRLPIEVPKGIVLLCHVVCWNITTSSSPAFYD